MAAQPGAEIGRFEARQREAREKQRADTHAQCHQRRDAEIDHADPDEQEGGAPQGGEHGQQESVLGRHRSAGAGTGCEESYTALPHRRFTIG
ncbi:hypothetical protein BA763_07360 [Burkholderia cenocepacia]|nr:hypothetical protein BA763_07360 [Burkholderia cenocepacia]